MNYLRITFFTLIVFLSLSVCSKDIGQVDSLQETVLNIYDDLLRTTVRVEVGSSGASAVLVSEDGYILTAAHVMDAVGGEETEVRLHDGSTYTAKCLGKDDLGDYGLMKIQTSKKLPYAPMGKVSALGKDDACLMFGHPATSEKERPAIGRIGFYEGINNDGYLKTSCIMMPGDSGGPIFNLKGELIGICSYINRGLNMNFYASIDNVKKNWERLVAGEVINIGEFHYDFSIAAAPENQGSHVLKGGKGALLTVMHSKSEKYQQAVVSIESNKAGILNQTYGTIFRSNGYVLAKSSEINDADLYCTLFNGERYEAKLLGRDEANDVVVLKINPSQKIESISINSDKELAVGYFVTTVLPGSESNSLVGIVGLDTRKILNKDTGFFGIQFSSREDLLLSYVDPYGAAAKGGLRNGDVITSFDKQKVQTRSDFYKYLPDTRPNQKVLIGVQRGGVEKELEVVLGKRRTLGNHPASASESNTVRDGFPNAFTHDIPILPTQCGTPVVNLEGEVIGINIARKNRVSTLAIPLGHLNQIVQNIINETGHKM